MLPTDVLTVIYNFATLITKAALSFLGRDLVDYHRQYLKSARPVSEKLYNHLRQGNIVPTEIFEFYTISQIDKLFAEVSGNGYTETVQLLLDRGADINAGNDSALRLASDNGHIKTVKLLLDRGADIHANNDEAIRVASSNGYT